MTAYYLKHSNEKPKFINFPQEEEDSISKFDERYLIFSIALLKTRKTSKLTRTKHRKTRVGTPSLKKKNEIWPILCRNTISR